MTENNQSYESILKEKSGRKSGSMSIKKTYPAYIILVLFIILSYFIWDQTKVMVKNNQKQEFNKAVTSVISRLETKKQRKLEVINSISGLYEILPFVVKDYFELYSTVPTITYPSILSISYATNVPDNFRDIFIHNTRSQGYYSYSIKPDGIRNEYLPVNIVVPLDGNSNILGLDLFTDDILNKAVLKARDSNTTVSTEFFNLRKEDTTSFFFIKPIYEKDSAKNNVNQRRKIFKGAVLIELDAPLFFENAINTNKNEGESFASDTTIIFRIKDNNKTVYHSKNSELFDKSDFTPLLQDTLEFAFADKYLNIEFATVPDFGGKFQKSLPAITLAISLVLSLAFFGFLLSLITSKARAVELAERMTRSQRRILETSNDMIAILDFNGNWKSINPASQKILNYSPDELIDNSIEKLFVTDEQKNEFYKFIENADDESQNKTDIEMKSKDGEFKWINWNFTISKTDHLIYAIGRDVTLEKIAEQQAILKSKQIQLAEQFALEASESKTYFMTKLSHQLRNNLTGIIGYLSLLSNKIYEDDEERDSYINLAEESSEEIFTFVSDIVDATLNTDTNEKFELKLLNVGKTFDNVKNQLNNDIDTFKDININVNDEINSTKAMADGNLLEEAFKIVFDALTQFKSNSEITINAQENPYEKMTEIQILGSKNEITEEMISIYKNNLNSLIDVLKYDKNDVIFNLSKISSIIRRMNGIITIETFGGDDGNLIMINLPLNISNE